MKTITVEIDEKMRQWAAEWSAEAERLTAESPSLGITAFIIATDNISARRMTEAVAAGQLTADEALHRVGSYARLDWAMQHLSEPALLAKLPELWRGCDPDDTRADYLAMWRRAFEANDRKRILDGRDLPFTIIKNRNVRLYRGQPAGEPIGLSWSLRYSVAVSFACGAAVRRPTPNGRVLVASCRTEHVMAYLTGRSEYEVIVDPANVTVHRTVGG